MASKDQIQAAILELAGQPESGWVKDNAEALADKIVSLDSTNGAATIGLTREKRVTEVAETR